MHSYRHLRRRLAAGILVLAAVAVPVTQATAAQPEPPTVPPTIAVPAGHKLFLVGHAVGVQIYKCTWTAGAYKWSFVAPRAELTDDDGRVIITHFAGPRWRAQDGSTILGARVDGVPAQDTIQWLLLSATSETSAKNADRLTPTKYIQRLATTGGVEPAAATCNAGTVNTVEEVPYTADYYFWKLK